MKKLISLILTICVMASLAICPVSAESADSLNVAYEGNGIFNVTGTVAGAEGAEYKLIMAEYDDENVFVGATTILDIETETFSTTLDFTANDRLASTIKLMLWDVKNATPLTEAVVNPKGNGGVNVATGDKATVGGTGSANVGLLGTAGSLIDGDNATWTGFYATRGTTGYIYLDLKGYYKIDRIEVLSYSDNANLNDAGARGTEYDVVLGNEVPDGTAFDAENPNGEFKAAYVDFDARAKDINVGYKTIYVPENAGEYRFVSFEKWDPERAGLLIGEVKVYVSEDDLTDRITNVALGKSVTENVLIAGTAESSASNGLAVITDGKKFSENKQQFISMGKGVYCLDLGSYYDVEKVTVDVVDDAYSSNVTVYLASEPYSATTGFPKEKTTLIEGAAAWGTDSKFIELATPVNARYIMLWKSDAAFRIGEIEVWGKENIPLANVALGKSVTENVLIAGTAESSYSNGVAAVTDGKLFAENTQQFISVGKGIYCLDLGSYYDVEKVLVDVVGTAYSSNVTVYLANEPYSATTGFPKEKTTLIEGAAAWDTDSKTIELETPVNARYIMLWKSDAAFRIGEIGVWGKENVPATNVALGRSTAENITCSPGLSGYTNDISCATDGKLCVGGNSQQVILAASPGWYCLDLGAEYEIEKVMVDCVTKDFTSYVSIHVASEPATETALPESKTTILNGASDANSWGVATKTVQLDEPVKGRYVIVERGGGHTGNGFRLGELEVWGK